MYIFAVFLQAASHWTKSVLVFLLAKVRIYLGFLSKGSSPCWKKDFFTTVGLLSTKGKSKKRKGINSFPLIAHRDPIKRPFRNIFFFGGGGLVGFSLLSTTWCSYWEYIRILFENTLSPFISRPLARPRGCPSHKNCFTRSLGFYDDAFTSHFREHIWLGHLWTLQSNQPNSYEIVDGACHIVQKSITTGTLKGDIMFPSWKRVDRRVSFQLRDRVGWRRLLNCMLTSTFPCSTQMSNQTYFTVLKLCSYCQ